MFAFDQIIGLFNSLSVMFLTALVIYGLLELAKLIWKDEGWRKYVVPALYVIGAIAYTSIAFAKGFVSPIITGLLNALLLVILESAMFEIIKGVGILISTIVALVKKWIEPSKS